MAIRNPEAGEIIRTMRKSLSEDITEFINEHAPELDLDYKSGCSSGMSSALSSGIQLSRDDSKTNLLALSESDNVINYQSGKALLRSIDFKQRY